MAPARLRPQGRAQEVPRCRRPYPRRHRTANACDPEQSAAVVALTERQTRTYIVPATVPGFMVIVTWLPLLIVGALLKLLHTPPVPFHCHCPMLPLWKLLP